MRSSKFFPCLVVAVLLVSACSAATPPTAAPTTAPAVATAAPAQPTSAPVAQPTAAPASAPTAAAPATTTTYPITVNDGVGKPVTLTKKPERIVCYAIACPDLLFDLGIAPVAVSGSTSYAEVVWGERAKSFAVIAAAGSGPNLEEVARAKPDLVIFSPPDAREALTVIAPSYQVNYTKGIQGTLNDLKMVGKLVGREAEAAAAEKRFQERLAAYKAKAPADLRVMTLFASATGVSVQSKASIVGGVLAEVSRYPWAAPPSGDGAYIGSFPYNLEQLLADDPDVLLINDFAFEAEKRPTVAQQNADQRKALEASPLWKELKAVKSGQVHFIDRRTMDPYSPIAAERMLDTVMPLLYPQVFPKALPAAPVQAAPATAPSVAFPLTVTDATGTTIALPKPAERVLCVLQVCVDVLAELEVAPAGVTTGMVPIAQHPRFFGARAAGFTVVSQAGAEPNLEEIARLKPDLVIAGPTYAGLRDGLRPIAPLFAARTTGSEADIIDNLKMIGRMLGRSEQAEAVAKRYLDKQAAYVAKAPKDMSVLVQYLYGDSGRQYATEKALVCAVLAKVARCAWPAPPNTSALGYLPLGADQLAQHNPDVLFVRTLRDGKVTDDQTAARESFRQSPFWREVAAVKTNRVHEVDTLIWGGYGTRSLTLVLDEALPLLYPQVFPKALP